ncbi:MAG TPA: hypothetical protein PLV92_22030, partial [Pirellulaceae bacterium]|nr:hypothetical protein [Pirellulaceae bacterium]
MSRNRLLDELDRVAVRYRNLRLWRSLAIAWLLAAVASLGLAAVRSWAGLQFGLALPVLGLALLSLVVVGVWLMRGGQRGYHWIARRIEAAFPELRTSLLAAIELRPELPDGRYGYLQMSVIRTAVRHAQQNSWT